MGKTISLVTGQAALLQTFWEVLGRKVLSPCCKTRWCLHPSPCLRAAQRDSGLPCSPWLPSHTMALPATCMCGRGVNHSSPLPGILQTRSLPQELQQRQGAFPYIHHTMYHPNNENIFSTKGKLSHSTQLSPCLKEPCLVVSPCVYERQTWASPQPGEPRIVRIALATGTIRFMGDSSQLCWKRCHGPIALPWPYVHAQV